MPAILSFRPDSRKFAFLAAFIACTLLLPCLPGRAVAASELVELEFAPFSMAVHPRLKLSLSQDQSEAQIHFAYVIPPQAQALDVLELSWAKGSRQAMIAIAQTSQPATDNGSEVLTTIAVAFEDEEPQVIDIPVELRSGVLSRLVIWPSNTAADSQLVALMSFTTGLDDAWLAGFVLEADGSGRMIELGGARTLYGWFDVEDIGGPDDDYELITRRNLDGTLGGFYYRAVRRWDAGLAAFVADPVPYQEFFKAELKFLDWVLLTAAQIEQAPHQYLSREDAGPQYVAPYEGEMYGFDMLITVPESFDLGGVGDRPGPSAADINASARRAVKYIRDYRDELQAWLAGGETPATWRMAR